jgi:cytoskeleton protein RodZ
MVLSRGPLVWAGAILLLAALAVYFVPAGNWFPRPGAAPAELPASAPANAASAASAASAALAEEAAQQVAMAGVPTAAETASAAPLTASLSASVPVAGAADGLAVLRAREPSWVEVRDGSDAVLLARTLQPGESVGLNGALPLRFKIGNAAVTELVFRGQPVNLASASRDNIARLELK